MLQKKHLSNNLFALIILLLLFPALLSAKTNLTFTSHPTNTKLGKAMYNAQSEIDYYHEKLANIIEVFLYEEENLLPEIGNLYSWIGYDFDRSNLTALDVIYSYNSGVKRINQIYKEYIQSNVENDYYSNAILDSLEAVKVRCQKIDSLISDNRSKGSLDEKFFFDLDLKLNKLALVQKEFELILNRINHSGVGRLIDVFAKFQFTLAIPQLRFPSDELNTKAGAEKLYKDIFKVVELIKKSKDNADFDIIIANFSSLKQIHNLKALKLKYNISTLNTLPLLETEKDVDYVIANLAKITSADKISQIMKAGSDDTKYSGMASSILNFSKVGVAIEKLKTKNKPVLFVGMGSSLERSGGPIFYRKMLASILGKNSTNRTLQGGELELFSTRASSLQKLKSEIEISKTDSTLDRKALKTTYSFLSKGIMKNYQKLYTDPKDREMLNYLIKDSTLGFLMDNFQAGFRYKQKISEDKDGNIVNKFNDIFDDTRAIDFQTTFVLSGLHLEFVPIAKLLSEEENWLCKNNDNQYVKTYMAALLLLSKQIHPEFYRALGLDEKAEIFQLVMAGYGKLNNIKNKCFTALNNEIIEQLKGENFLDYSESSNKEIARNLAKANDYVKLYKAKKLDFKTLRENLLKLNYNIAKERNLLNEAVKN